MYVYLVEIVCVFGSSEMLIQGKIIDGFFYDICVYILIELEFNDKIWNCILMVNLVIKMNGLNVMFILFNFIKKIIFNSLVVFECFMEVIYFELQLE